MTVAMTALFASWNQFVISSFYCERIIFSHVKHYCGVFVYYLLCLEPCWWLDTLGGLILLLAGTPSIFWLFSPGFWLGAWISDWVSLCALSRATAAVKDFCLLRIASLPALISFSPTLRTRVRPAKAGALGYSFLGEGSLDPPPAGGGRESLEALDILQVSGSVKLLYPSQLMVLQLCPMSNPEVS